MPILFFTALAHYAITFRRTRRAWQQRRTCRVTGDSSLARVPGSEGRFMRLRTERVGHIAGASRHAERERSILGFAGFFGRLLISLPAPCSAIRTSYSVWRFIQNCGLVPNQCARRSAVSPVTARLPLMICRRRTGTTPQRRPGDRTTAGRHAGNAASRRWLRAWNIEWRAPCWSSTPRVRACTSTRLYALTIAAQPEHAYKKLRIVPTTKSIR